MTLEMDLPLGRGEALAWLYRQGALINHQDHETGIHLCLPINPVDYA